MSGVILYSFFLSSKRALQGNKDYFKDLTKRLLS